METKEGVKDKLANRGYAMAKMGLVGKEKDGERWEVKSPLLRGYQRSFFVNTNKESSFCTCLDYEYANERGFFCEHKWAVYYFCLNTCPPINVSAL